jgi:hypothetical protein
MVKILKESSREAIVVLSSDIDIKNFKLLALTGSDDKIES